MQIKSYALPNPAIPTGDVRHTAAIREGAQSGECWSRAQRALWHEEYDGPPISQKKLREVKDENTEVVAERGKEGSSENEKTIRGKGRGKNLPGSSGGQGDGQEPNTKDQERIQKAKAAKRRKALTK